MLDAKAAKQWERLPSLQKRRLQTLGTHLEIDPTLGQRLLKSRFPKALGRVDNLWRLA